MWSETIDLIEWGMEFHSLGDIIEKEDSCFLLSDKVIGIFSLYLCNVHCGRDDLSFVSTSVR